MGGAKLSDSGGYHGDSERYQESEASPDLRHGKFADEWMPDRALGEAAGGTDGLEPNRREWQVNIRLDRKRYAELKRAAEVYGTSPTALARMLLNRGSTAILNAYRAEMSTFEWRNPRR